LNIFQYRFRKLSRLQKERLLNFIQVYFAQFRDRMAWFTISEILGEQYRDESAYEVLCRLRSTKQFEPRSFVPHGFEHVIRESGDILLSRTAIGQLYEMTKDRSKYVRREAEISLARVKNHFALGTPFKDKSVLELVTKFRTSWNYKWEVEFSRKVWREYGVHRPPWERYFSTVGWKTPCCKFEVEVNFKLSGRQANGRGISFTQQPQVSWLRSKWEPLDKRIGIPCGSCGDHRRPNWNSLLGFARKKARELPDFSKQT
ncbi:MAG TPA: hypothetical protein VKF81_07545, partial [Blastocatellia bacterium]|nr:hypothetical protein [Blastocatellia bacterium]